MTSALIGIITVRGHDYPPTLRLAQAARFKGCRVVTVNPYAVWPAFDKGRPVLMGDPAVSDCDAVLPRQGAEIKDACLPLIDHFEKMGVVVINAKPAVELARNKFFTLQALAADHLPVLDTIFVTAPNGFQEALTWFGDPGAVVKPVSGRQGSDLRHMRAGDLLNQRLRAELDQGRGLLVQRFLPPDGRRDLRILVIGGRVAAAMALVPVAGDFRANAHLGGQGLPVLLSTSEAALAVRAATVLGLEIAGVDMMIAADGHRYVGEVNYAPGFRMLESATGVDVAGALIDYVLSRITS